MFAVLRELPPVSAIVGTCWVKSVGRSVAGVRSVRIWTAW
jgi:hypothetical protein